MTRLEQMIILRNELLMTGQRHDVWVRIAVDPPAIRLRLGEFYCVVTNLISDHRFILDVWRTGGNKVLSLQWNTDGNAEIIALCQPAQWLDAFTKLMTQHAQMH